MHTNIFSLFELNDRVAIITGGAGLIGAEFSKTLAQAGAKVVIADLDHTAADLLAKKMADDGLQALSVGVDIGQKASVLRMIDSTLNNFGRLDILVNCAALDPKFDPQHAEESSDSGAFEDYPLEMWNKALTVNLTGTFLCSQAAVRPMLAQGQGVIINICSIYGLVGPDQRLYSEPGKPQKFKPAYYSVTKAGIDGFTRYLAAYYAGKNIRVNSLTPGGVFNGHDEAFSRAYSTRTILGRMAGKDELNGALLFLASDASKYMTGANLIVDGGWTAW
jgi:NAD(P)-dependent dehydrogenase (short-subunit alcohol dehydrogenase family)